MITSKKLSLQLTPLLDLLLIVIFAQYLEMEQQTEARNEKQSIEHSQMLYEVGELKKELKFTKGVLEEIQKIRLKSETLAEAMKVKQKASQEKAETAQRKYEEKLQDFNEQRTRLISAIQEAFADSSEDLKKLLDEMASSSSTSPAIPIDQIEQLSEELTKSEIHEIASFLMAYEELRKRCDVWEVHLDQSGIAHLKAGEKEFPIRIVSAEDFQRQFFDIYKSLPQAKGLVIILVSYEEVARSVRENLLLSLPDVTERMRKDADGRTRFEYATIGYLPKKSRNSIPEK